MLAGGTAQGEGGRGWGNLSVARGVTAAFWNPAGPAAWPPW